MSEAKLFSKITENASQTCQKKLHEEQKKTEHTNHRL